MPFKNPLTDSISGILTAYNNRKFGNNVNTFSINAFSRYQLLHDNNQNNKERGQLLKWILFYEKTLNQYTDFSTDIKKELCNIGPINFEGDYIQSEKPCFWVLEYLCISNDEYYNYTTEFEKDDDGDGAKNKDDQDWWREQDDPEIFYEFIYRYDNDGDGYFNYEDEDFNTEGYIFEWAEIVEAWENIGDWFADFFDDMYDLPGDVWDHVEDWWDDLWRPGIDCYEWDDIIKPKNNNSKGINQQAESKLKLRSGGNCGWFFSQYCDDGRWWTRVEYHGVLDPRNWVYTTVDNTRDHWRMNCSTEDIINIAYNAGCDFYNPDVKQREECILNAYHDYFINLINENVIQDFPDMSAEQILEVLTDNGKSMYECSCELNNIEFKSCVTCKINRQQFFERQEVKEFIANNSICDPCDPSKSTIDIFEAFANENCMKNLKNVSLDDVVFGFLLIDESFINCKSLYCVWNDLFHNCPHNFCTLLTELKNSGKSLRIAMGDLEMFPEYKPLKAGQTQIQDENGHVTIYFNPRNCVEKFAIGNGWQYSDFLETAGTIIHEMVHAEIYNEITANAPDNFTELSQSTFYITMLELLKNDCSSESGQLTVQHYFMIKNWVYKMALDLWNFNNNTGSVSDYEYVVWSGLYDDETLNYPCIKTLITEELYGIMNSNYEHLYSFDPNKSLILAKQNKLNDCISGK